MTSSVLIFVSSVFEVEVSSLIRLEVEEIAMPFFSLQVFWLCCFHLTMIRHWPIFVAIVLQFSLWVFRFWWLIKSRCARISQDHAEFSQKKINKSHLCLLGSNTRCPKWLVLNATDWATDGTQWICNCVQGLIAFDVGRTGLTLCASSCQNPGFWF